MTRWLAATLAAVLGGPATAAAPAAAQTEDVAPGSQAPPILPGTSRVHLDSPRPVALEVARPSGAWQKLCDAPCDALMKLGERYRVGGPEVPPSGVFELESVPRQALRVDPSTKRSLAWPAATVVIGGLGLAPTASVTTLKVLVFVLGLGACAVTGVQAFAGSTAGDYASRYSGCLRQAGVFGVSAYLSPYVWIPEAAGTAVAFLGGIWFLHARGGQPTRVTVTGVTATRATAAFATAPPPPAHGGTWVWTAREPMAAAMPAAMTVPLLDAAF